MFDHDLDMDFLEPAMITMDSIKKIESDVTLRLIFFCTLGGNPFLPCIDYIFVLLYHFYRGNSFCAINSVGYRSWAGE